MSHKLTKVKQEQYPCQAEGCGLVYINEAALQEHVRRQHAPRPFKCLKCKKAYVQLWALKRHVHTAHGGPSVDREPPTDPPPTTKVVDLAMDETSDQRSEAPSGPASKKTPRRSGAPVQTQGPTMSGEPVPASGQQPRLTEALVSNPAQPRITEPSQSQKPVISPPAQAASLPPSRAEIVGAPPSPASQPRASLSSTLPPPTPLVQSANPTFVRCTECSMAYQDRKNLVEHLASQHINVQIYICPKCGGHLRNIVDYLSHTARCTHQ